MIKRRRLEFATDESSEEETNRTKKTKKRRAKNECENEWGTSASEDSGSRDSRRKSSEKTKNQNGRHFKKWLTLEKFDKKTLLSIFLNQLDTCAQYNRWDEEDKASHLRVSLKGNAAYIIDDENLEGASYSKLIKRLKNRFGTEGQSSLYRSQLRTRRRGKDETLQTLYHDINRIAGLTYPGKSSIHRELAATDAFIDALNDSNLRMRVRDKEPKNFGPRAPHSVTRRGEHRNETERYTRRTRRWTEGGPRCYSCQGYGHMARSCPKADKKKGDNTPAENVPGVGVRGPDVRQMKDHPVYLKAYLGKRKVDFLVDTGCDRSVTPRTLIGDAILEPADCRLFAANGTVINVVGEVSMNIRIGDLILPTRFVVSDNITKPMLGVDWLRCNRMI